MKSPVTTCEWGDDLKVTWVFVLQAQTRPECASCTEALLAESGQARSVASPVPWKFSQAKGSNFADLKSHPRVSLSCKLSLARRWFGAESHAI